MQRVQYVGISEPPPTDIARLGSTICAASFADELGALNLEDARLLWKLATGASNQDCLLPPSALVVGQLVFYAGLDGILYVYGLDGHSGKLLWKHITGTASPRT